MRDKLNQWVDATTYSRDRKERIPTAWQYDTGELLVYVTCGHRYYAGQWFVVCHKAGVESILKMPASASPSQTEIETAQSHAIGIVKRRLQKMIDSLHTL